MNAIAITKKAVSLLIAAGVSKIVNDVIANNVAIEKTHQKVTVPLASIAIGGVVADAASDYTDNLIDETVDLCKEIAARFRK